MLIHLLELVRQGSTLFDGIPHIAVERVVVVAAGGERYELFDARLGGIFAVLIGRAAGDGSGCVVVLAKTVIGILQITVSAVVQVTLQRGVGGVGDIRGGAVRVLADHVAVGLRDLGRATADHGRDRVWIFGGARSSDFLGDGGPSLPVHHGSGRHVLRAEQAGVRGQEGAAGGVVEELGVLISQVIDATVEVGGDLDLGEGAGCVVDLGRAVGFCSQCRRR